MIKGQPYGLVGWCNRESAIRLHQYTTLGTFSSESGAEMLITVELSEIQGI